MKTSYFPDNFNPSALWFVAYPNFAPATRYHYPSPTGRSLGDLEKERVNRDMHRSPVVNVEQRMGVEVSVSLVHDPVREVSMIGRVIRCKEPIEIPADGE